MRNGNSVMIQNGGKGFETDAVISSLAQLLLDPFYRTFDGFCVLLDKEWITMGYNFASGGHEAYSVFFLFFNSVWELMQLYPLSFTFSEDLLIFVLDNIFSKQFSTFLYDTEKARTTKAAGTASIFVYLANTTHQEPFIAKVAQPLNEIDLIRSEINAMPWFRALFRWNPWLRANTLNTKKELKATLQQASSNNCLISGHSSPSPLAFAPLPHHAPFTPDPIPFSHP